MAFSKITLGILDLLKKLRAAGDPDADRKLAEAIEAAIAGQPIPAFSTESSLRPAETRSISGRERTEEVKRRACAKIIDGIPLDPEEENAMISGNLF